MHLPQKRSDQVAILWEGDDPKDSKKITYKELHDNVCRLANVLRNLQRREGRPRHHLSADDPRGGLRHPRLRAHRRGPLRGVRRFSRQESLAGRIEDCKSKVVITADEGLRGGRKVPLKANTDAAIDKAGGVDHVIVVRRTGAAVNMLPGRRHRLGTTTPPTW